MARRLIGETQGGQDAPDRQVDPLSIGISCSHSHTGARGGRPVEQPIHECLSRPPHSSPHLQRWRTYYLAGELSTEVQPVHVEEVRGAGILGITVWGDKSRATAPKSSGSLRKESGFRQLSAAHQPSWDWAPPLLEILVAN
jgi:hypothetical protein